MVSEPTERQTVVRTLARVARVLDASCEGLTLAQYRVLARVVAGHSRASRISSDLALTKPTITAAIDGLEASGWLTRVADPDDRRVVQLEATAAGRAMLRRAEGAMADRLDELLAVVPDRDGFVAACSAIGSELDRQFESRRAERDRSRS